MLIFLENNTDLAQAITSICSMIVSVIALLLSTYTAFSQIRFNKKSVLPFCHITFETVKFTTTISIRNSGMGTMIVNKIIYKNDSQKTDTLSEIIGKAYYKEFFQWNYSESSLSSGESVKLIEIVVNNHVQLENLLKILENITVSVSYEDIFSKKYDTKLPLKDLCKTLRKTIAAKQIIHTP